MDPMLENLNRLSVYHDAPSALTDNPPFIKTDEDESKIETVTDITNSLTPNISSPTLSSTPSSSSLVPERSILRKKSSQSIEPASVNEDGDSTTSNETTINLIEEQPQASASTKSKSRRPSVPSRHPQRASEGGSEPGSKKNKRKSRRLSSKSTHSDKSQIITQTIPSLKVTEEKDEDPSTAEKRLSTTSIPESKGNNNMDIIEDYDNCTDEEDTTNVAKEENDSDKDEDESYDIHHYHYDSEASSEGDDSYDTEYDSFDENDFEMITASTATAAVVTMRNGTGAALIDNDDDITDEASDNTGQMPREIVTMTDNQEDENNFKAINVPLQEMPVILNSYENNNTKLPPLPVSVAAVSVIKGESQLPAIQPTRVLLDIEELSQYTTKITKLSLSLLESENQRSVLSSKLHHLNTIYNKNQDIINNYRQEITSLRTETNDLGNTLFAETDDLIKKSQQEKENLEDECEILRRKLSDKDDQLDGTKEMLMQMKMIIQQMENERKSLKEEALEFRRDNVTMTSLLEKTSNIDLNETTEDGNSLNCPRRPCLRVDIPFFKEFAELIPLKNQSVFNSTTPQHRGFSSVPTQANGLHSIAGPNGSSIQASTSPKLVSSAAGFNSPASTSSSTFMGFPSFSTSSSLPNSPTINSYSTFLTPTMPAATTTITTSSISGSLRQQPILSHDRQSIFTSDTASIDQSYHSDLSSITSTSVKSYQQTASSKSFYGHSDSNNSMGNGGSKPVMMKMKKASHDGLNSFKDTKFFKRCLIEDIEPIFKFDFHFAPHNNSNVMTKKKLLESIIDGKVLIEPISGINEAWLKREQQENIMHTEGSSKNSGQLSQNDKTDNIKNHSHNGSQISDNNDNSNSNNSQPNSPGIDKEFEAKENEINQLKMYLYPVNGPPIAVMNCCSICGESRNDFIKFARMYNLRINSDKKGWGGINGTSKAKTLSYGDNNNNNNYDSNNVDQFSMDDDDNVTTGGKKRKLYPLCRFCVNRVRATCDFITFLHNLTTGIWRIEGNERDQFTKMKPYNNNNSFKTLHGSVGCGPECGESESGDNEDTIRAWKECVRLRERMFWSRNAGSF